MAIASILDIARLDDGYILAPERYDPRRRHAEHVGPCLSDVVNILREQTNSTTADVTQSYLVLDTGDAHNGIVKTTKSPCDATAIGSTKKRVRAGQVIISRLRPYLRQVAWVDAGLLGVQAPSLQLLCSTEFFVLDSRDGASIAFLVPFFLSPHVQSVLAAAQEGGHHPRFNERTLKALPIPSTLIKHRTELSAQVEHAVNRAREAFGKIDDGIESVAQLVEFQSEEL